MPNETIFFDLPSRGTPTCWSLNPWKARLALNFKGLPYKTQWIEYPHLAPTFKNLGIPPNSKDVNPNAEYSIPAAKLPDGRYIMDSLAIAYELEKLQPEPSLKLDGEGAEWTKKTQAALGKVTVALTPICMPRVPEMLLNPSSETYFNETRHKRFGMPLTELAKSEKAVNAWTNAREGLEEVKALLASNAGPYIQGEEVSFADFILAGFWRFAEKLDKDGDLFGKLMEYDGSFKEHYEANKKWLERDD